MPGDILFQFRLCWIYIVTDLCGLYVIAFAGFFFLFDLRRSIDREFLSHGFIQVVYRTCKRFPGIFHRVILLYRLYVIGLLDLLLMKFLARVYRQLGARARRNFKEGKTPARMRLKFTLQCSLG